MTAGRRAPRALAPLRHRGFRLLAAGQFASNAGDACYAVALPWYVLAAHGGPLLLGTVLVAYGVPRTALVVVGGNASDRWRPWTVMTTTDAARAVAAGALAVAAGLGPARAVILVPIAAVLGAGEGLFIPASFAIIPALLPDDDLQAGNALVSSGTQLAMLAGPAMGGVLVALLGPSPAFAVNAASFAVSAVTLAGVRAGRRRARPVLAAAAHAAAAPGGPGTAYAPDAAGAESLTVRGLLRSARVLQIALLVTVAANLGSAGVDEVALPSLAHGPMHAGAGGYGALLAAFGAGALLGTIVAGQARRARRPAILGSVVFLAQALFLGIVPFLGAAVPAGAALVAVGAANGFGNVVMITAFQRWAPRHLLGRLGGLMALSSLGIFPVSVALAALVVHDFGPAPFFPLAAGALAVAVLAGLSQRSWRSFGVADRPAAPPDTFGLAPDTRAPDTRGLAPGDPHHATDGGRPAPAAAEIRS